MKIRDAVCAALIAALIGVSFAAGPSAAADRRGPEIYAGKVAVTTYHYDSLRSGWNYYEAALTPATVSQATFGMSGVMVFDDQVDAQPLIVPNVTLTGGPYAGTTHDVAYIVTAANSVYGVDATTGSILLYANLGPPVPASRVNCLNNSQNIGITSTPVIDLASQTIYVMAFTSTGSATPPIYQLHGLDIRDLTHHQTLNNGQPVTVAATHTLTDGSTYTFNALVQRQRAALLEANGNIYAAFASFCDNSAGQSRGWVLGWNASTLKPLATSQLNNTLAPPQPPPPQAPINWFLSSVWMSGYGIAASGSQIYFTTGNSDCNFEGNPPGTAPICPKTSSWDGIHNIQESAVRMEGDLSRIDGVWSPSNRAVLDTFDGDLGSGGLLLINSFNSVWPLMAVTAGKDGNLFLFRSESSGALTLLDQHRLDECWCGPSWFIGPDGGDRVVTSQGSTLQTWQIQSPTSPHLVAEAVATLPSTEQDGGFFTTVSSWGTSNAIIWAVTRPTGVVWNPTGIALYAFDAHPTGSPATFKQVYTLPAGAWPNVTANANIVPVVANGHVYVASAANDPTGVTCPKGRTCGLLVIYGLNGRSDGTVAQAAQMSQVASLSAPYVVSGTLVETSGSTLVLKTRTGKTAKVDASTLMRKQKIGVPLVPGVPLTVQGSSVSSTGAIEAASIIRAKGRSGALWPPDKGAN